MILTGSKINQSVREGNISISPFDQAELNPNSYNYRLGSELKMAYEDGSGVHFLNVGFPEAGLILQPGNLYLGQTAEKIGSSSYAMSLIGRSSLGRLGLFLQVSANLGHTGSNHQWTLELYACQPIKIYPNMRIGQVSFWTNIGEMKDYERYYSNFNSPQKSNTFNSHSRLLEQYRKLS